VNDQGCSSNTDCCIIRNWNGASPHSHAFRHSFQAHKEICLLKGR